MAKKCNLSGLLLLLMSSLTMYHHHQRASSLLNRIPILSPPHPRDPIEYMVGGDTGWTDMNGGNNMSAWASAAGTFVAGDTLVFEFRDGEENVAQVPSREAYESCDIESALFTVVRSPANIVIDYPGSLFFISSIQGGRRCRSGLRLAITAISRAQLTVNTPPSPTQTVAPAPAPAPAPSPAAPGS
ncbi:hypothetical protein Droror1_Dr00025794 [Drosera rotundifolia]